MCASLNKLQKFNLTCISQMSYCFSFTTLLRGGYSVELKNISGFDYRFYYFRYQSIALVHKS